MIDWMSSLIGSTLVIPPTALHNIPLWLAEVSEADIEPLILATVLLSLIVVYLSAKLGGRALCPN